MDMDSYYVMKIKRTKKENRYHSSVSICKKHNQNNNVAKGQEAHCKVVLT